MYHVRKASDHDERSLHREDMQGLYNAIQEGVLRTHYTREAHQIVDDNGKIIHIVEFVPGATSVVEPPKTSGSIDRVSAFLLSAALVAMLVFWVARSVL